MESFKASGAAKRRRLMCGAMPGDGVKVKNETSAEHEVGSESPEKGKLEMDDLWLELKRQTEDMENHIRRLVSCDNESSLAQAAAKVPESVGALGAADEEATPRHKKIKVTFVAMAATEHPSLPAMEQPYKLAKQSGVQNIWWGTKAFAWGVKFPKLDSKGNTFSWTNRVFAVKKFMVPGRTAAEADAAALEAAKAFRTELVEKGILRDSRLKDPNFTSEVPGVRWDKTAEKWRVQIQNRKMWIEGGYFTEKAAAEAKALELREKHGLQLQVKPVPTLANLPMFHPKVPHPGVVWFVRDQTWRASCYVGGARREFRVRPKDHSEVELERSFNAAVRWRKKQEKEKKGKVVKPKAKPGKNQ